MNNTVNMTGSEMQCVEGFRMMLQGMSLVFGTMAGSLGNSLEDSWMIGDGENDVKAGMNAGCRTALIGTEDYGQDMTAGSLFQAVETILGR